MSKYIDAEKLKAEIERLKKHSQEAKMEFMDDGYTQNAFAEDCRLKSFDKLLSFIASLQEEQSEVDLDKEYESFVTSDPVYSKLTNGIVGKAIARHFYELGKNAK